MQITAEDSNHRRVTRNVSFFKKIINNYQKSAQTLDSENVNQSNRATYACEQEVPRPAENNQSENVMHQYNMVNQYQWTVSK